MSARPAFADPTTFRPLTTFAGGVNPWGDDHYVPQARPAPKPTKTTTSKATMKTAHLPSSPFTGAGTKPSSSSGHKDKPQAREAEADIERPAKRNGPAPGSAKYRPRVDLATLKVESGVPLPMYRQTDSKYSDVFRKLKPKDCITCRTEEVMPVATALRKWLKDTRQQEALTVISARTITEDPERGVKGDPNHGRVWMWPRGEAVDWMPAKSRGGAVRNQRAKAGK